MEKILKVTVILVIIFALFMLISPYIVADMIQASLGRPTMMSKFVDKVKDSVHTGEYDKYLKEYVEVRFGNVIEEKLKISDGRWSDFNVHAYSAHFDDIMEDGFTIYIYKDTGGGSDSFSQVLSKDQKFQHLYSEWVKKQVGIEDENVEFEFTGTFDTPYIEFDKITTLSEDYSEVFENTHNFKLMYMNIKQYKDFNIKNIINYTKNFLEKNNVNMLNMLSSYGCSEYSISFFSYDFDFNVPGSLEFDKFYGSKDNINNYTVTIKNGEIIDTIHYSYTDEYGNINVEEMSVF